MTTIGFDGAAVQQNEGDARRDGASVVDWVNDGSSLSIFLGDYDLTKARISRYQHTRPFYDSVVDVDVERLKRLKLEILKNTDVSRAWHPELRLNDKSPR